MNLDPVVRVHVSVAVRAHIRQLRRDGRQPPAGLDALAEELDRDDRETPLERIRRQDRERQRRSRARKRGVNVPKRQPGTVPGAPSRAS